MKSDVTECLLLVVLLEPMRAEEMIMQVRAEVLLRPAPSQTRS